LNSEVQEYFLQGNNMSIRYMCLCALVVLATAFTGQVRAQSDQGLESRVFGQGQPAKVDDLPPGQLKRKITELPPQAKSRAMQWLQDFSFPEADVVTLNVDAQGNVHYVDTLVVDEVEAAAAVGEYAPGAAPASTLDDAFVLHSRPGAANRVFIDFDGHVISGTAWGGGATYDARPYNLDGDPNTFNSTERGRIVDIWHRVAEDLSMFDIDVTTEEPASFDRYTGRILVTHSQDETGADMPYPTAGGVAYVNVFGNSNYHTYTSPALVYFNNLGGGVETYVAEASSHEFGHNLGLSHDGLTSGTTYYAGHGAGLVSWAPIMGNSYYNNVTEWSKGEYTGANQTQDDLAIIDGKLGYVGDDHGDSTAAASALDVAGDGSVVSSNPEFDPHNVLPENKGVINNAGDVDVFAFLAGSGTVELTVTPAWDAFYRSTSRRGANLDIQAELRDVNGDFIASSDPLTDTSATLNVAVGSGAYYLLISGVGNAVTPYSDYDSLGQYFINGSVPPAAADETPPTPNPMAFASPPAAASASAISMTAATAIDDVSAVQYEFRCTAGGSGCASSGWLSSTSHTASGLDADTQYTFTVVARDQSGNETQASGPASATTDAPPPFVDYESSSDTAVSGTVSGTHTATHSANGSAQSITERESGGKKNSRYTYLEHRWNFNIGAGATVTVYAQAWKSGSNSSESFDLEWSTNNGGSFTWLMNIASTNNGTIQFAPIPGAPGGSIILRVKDTHQQAGDRNKSTFHLDHLYIQVGNGTGEPPPSDPPAAPSGMTATAASSSAIDLSWTDGSNDELGFSVERSPDGTTNWVEIAALPGGAQSHGDTGLEAATQYFYRVSAYNGNGSSGYSSAEATTDAAPPPPPPGALELSASGYKSKGKHGVILDWTGADSVDVYRDGSIVAFGATGGTYDDFIGAKGGASYEHYVCEAGGTSSCSNSTTTVF
jgi:hypothetical protein